MNEVLTVTISNTHYYKYKMQDSSMLVGILTSIMDTEVQAYSPPMADNNGDMAPN